MKVFEEGLFVHRRLGLHQLMVDPLEHVVVALGEGIVQRLVDRVVGVAAGAVDVGDRVAGGAGDAGMGGGMVHVVVVGIVEGAAIERHRIVAAGAPAGRLHVAVSLPGHLAGFANARQIRGVVEGAEVVGAIFPAGMHVGMTLHAVVVHHQRVGWDVVACGGAGERGLKVFRTFLGALCMPVAGVLGMQADHRCD